MTGRVLLFTACLIVFLGVFCAQDSEAHSFSEVTDDFSLVTSHPRLYFGIDDKKLIRSRCGVSNQAEFPDDWQMWKTEYDAIVAEATSFAECDGVSNETCDFLEGDGEPSETDDWVWGVSACVFSWWVDSTQTTLRTKGLNSWLYVIDNMSGAPDVSWYECVQNEIGHTFGWYLPAAYDMLFSANDGISLSAGDKDDLGRSMWATWEYLAADDAEYEDSCADPADCVHEHHHQWQGYAALAISLALYGDWSSPMGNADAIDNADILDRIEWYNEWGKYSLCQNIGWGGYGGYVGYVQFPSAPMILGNFIQYKSYGKNIWADDDTLDCIAYGYNSGSPDFTGSQWEEVPDIWRGVSYQHTAPGYLTSVGTCPDLPGDAWTGFGYGVSTDNMLESIVKSWYISALMEDDDWDQWWVDQVVFSGNLNASSVPQDHVNGWMWVIPNVDKDDFSTTAEVSTKRVWTSHIEEYALGNYFGCGVPNSITSSADQVKYNLLDGTGNDKTLLSVVTSTGTSNYHSPAYRGTNYDVYAGPWMITVQNDPYPTSEGEGHKNYTRTGWAGNSVAIGDKVTNNTNASHNSSNWYYTGPTTSDDGQTYLRTTYDSDGYAGIAYDCTEAIDVGSATITEKWVRIVGISDTIAVITHDIVHATTSSDKKQVHLQVLHPQEPDLQSGYSYSVGTAPNAGGGTPGYTAVGANRWAQRCQYGPGDYEVIPSDGLRYEVYTVSARDNVYGVKKTGGPAYPDPQGNGRALFNMADLDTTDESGESHLELMTSPQMLAGRYEWQLSNDNRVQISVPPDSLFSAEGYYPSYNSYRPDMDRSFAYGDRGQMKEGTYPGGLSLWRMAAVIDDGNNYDAITQVGVPFFPAGASADSSGLRVTSIKTTDVIGARGDLPSFSGVQMESTIVVFNNSL